jgi:undecaprenyl-diphosphatase
MSWLQAVVLAIVEGITEFLPISSTGHMIIAAHIMGIGHDRFVKVFEVAIQFGAILSVVVLYFKRFLKSWSFYAKLFVAFLPTAIIGLLAKKYVDQMLESVTVVAVSLLLGGIVLLFIDKWFADNESQPDAEPSYQSGFWIGLIQAVSMIPGVSRAAATIIGGLSQKLNRKSAAEFSFFLAVPTMFAATVKSMWDEKELFLQADTPWLLLAVGNMVAFVVALLAIRGFIGYLTRHGFKVFGYYRIALGTLLLVLLYVLRWDIQLF